MNEFSFIHLADVNIGIRPDADSAWCDRRYNEIKKTFENIIAYANEQDVDFILISGDLYNHVPDEDELKELDKICSSLKNTCVIYSTGEMDYLKQNSPLADYEFQSNIYILGRNRLPQHIDSASKFYAVRSGQASYMMDCLRFEKFNLNVYGISYFDKRNIMPPLDGIDVSDKDSVYILLAHGGGKNSMPVHFQELKNAGFTYVAMGHRHRYEQISDTICYPGTPEPLSESETGRHGFIYGNITENGFRKQFVPIAAREYKTLNYPVSNYMKDADIIDDIRHLISVEGKQHIYTINLVRLDGCEKNFEVASLLDDFNILRIEGELFERTDYDRYIKANRNNEFAGLLDEMYADAPEKRDGAKLAVDTMIDLSGINRRRGNKMSAKVYDDARHQTMKLLTAKRSSVIHSEEVQEYEKVKKELDISPDVLDKLNETWAKERQAELEYRTTKLWAEEFPKNRKRRRIQFAIRLVLVPLILLGLLFIITLPQGLMKASYANQSERYALSMLIVAFSIMICVCATYCLSKHTARITGGMRSGGKYSKEKLDEKLLMCREKVETLRTERRKLQLLESQRKGLLEEVSIREQDAEKIYYEVRLIDEAIEILKQHDGHYRKGI